MGFDIDVCLTGFWDLFQGTKTHSRTCDGYHVFDLWLRVWQFYWYEIWHFLTYSFRFYKSPVDISCYSCNFILCFRFWIIICLFCRQNEHTTMKRTWSTSTGTYGRGGCLDTTRSSFTRRTPSSPRILSPANAVTQFLSTDDLKSISGIYEFLVCTDTSTSPSRVRSIYRATYNNIYSAFSSTIGQVVQAS